MPTNAGFRPEELSRRRFQTVAAVTMDKQAEAIQVTREVIADVSVRLDNLERRQRSFEQLPFFARMWWLLRGR